MKRSDSRAALTDETARFQAEVHRLALAVARVIVAEELERKRAKLEAARPRVAAPRPERARAAPRPKLTPAPSAVAPELADAAAAPAAPDPAAPPPAAAPGGGRKRVPWTREAIISELATWMLSGTAIDARFVTRHGPPGLVAATRRIFGRFDAALNVAALHVSKLYPDGPPDAATAHPPRR
jgi:hypothetical protein